MTAKKATTAATPAAAKAPTYVVTVGDLTIDVANLDATVQAYGQADTGTKTKIRNAIQAAMGAAVMDADLTAAQAYAAATKAIQSVAPAKAETDYTQVVIDRTISIMYAAHLLRHGNVVPEGIDAATIDGDRFEKAVKAYLDGDLDAVSDTQADAGRKLAAAKITRTTVRGSVEAHIEAAFEGMPAGTVLTVAQIRTRSGAASDGAIAARLWPTDKNKVAKPTTIDLVGMGIELTDRDGVRAVRKVRD